MQLQAGWNPQWRLRHHGSHPHFLDWPSGCRRLATRQDVTDMAKMAHVLDEFDRVGKVLTCSEIDQRIEPLWAVLELAQITDKVIAGGEIFYPQYIEPLVRMAEVLSGQPGDTSLIAAGDFFISPLILDPKQAACFMEKRRFGMPTVVGSMAISGMSAPVTLAGTVAVAVAEFLAGWVLSYVVNPDLPASGAIATGSLDLRTLNACFASPEAVLQNVATVNLCRRLYGISAWSAINYVDCKRPGLEAAYMKMYGLLGAPFGAERIPGTDGLLSAGQDYSPVQHLLDNEIARAVTRFWGHFEVNDETLAVDLVQQIMAGPTTNFLDTEHTLSHYRSQHWYPKWLDRSAWQGAEYEVDAERRMLERVDRYWRDAIARYQRPEIDTAKIRELEAIYKTAERGLLAV